MHPTDSNGGDIPAGNNGLHGDIAGRRRIVAKLSVAVVAPAPHAAADHGTSVKARSRLATRRGNRRRAAARRDTDNRRQSLRKSAVADLAIEIGTPAMHPAIGHRTGVILSCRHVDNSGRLRRCELVQAQWNREVGGPGGIRCRHHQVVRARRAAGCTGKSDIAVAGVGRSEAGRQSTDCDIGWQWIADDEQAASVGSAGGRTGQGGRDEHRLRCDGGRQHCRRYNRQSTYRRNDSSCPASRARLQPRLTGNLQLNRYSLAQIAGQQESSKLSKHGCLLDDARSARATGLLFRRSGSGWHDIVVAYSGEVSNWQTA